MSSKNDITGDRLVSKVSSGEAKKAYDEAWERCFGKKKKQPIEIHTIYKDINENTSIRHRDSTEPSTCLGSVATKCRD